MHGQLYGVQRFLSFYWLACQGTLLMAITPTAAVYQTCETLGTDSTRVHSSRRAIPQRFVPLSRSSVSAVVFCCICDMMNPRTTMSWAQIAQSHPTSSHTLHWCRTCRSLSTPVHCCICDMITPGTDHVLGLNCPTIPKIQSCMTVLAEHAGLSSLAQSHRSPSSHT